MPSTQVKRGNPTYGRWTDAKTGKEPTLKLLQQGRMPKTGKRQRRAKA